MTDNLDEAWIDDEGAQCICSFGFGMNLSCPIHGVSAPKPMTPLEAAAEALQEADPHCDCSSGGKCFLCLKVARAVLTAAIDALGVTVPKAALKKAMGL